MTEGLDRIDFVDNGNAPEFFANELHEIDVMGSVCRFVHAVYRRTPGGLLYKEPVFTCVMPISQVGAAINLIIERVGVSTPLALGRPTRRKAAPH